MHYRNGKTAFNGDKIVQLGANGEILTVGVLFGATPGNDYCNGEIAPIRSFVTTAYLIDCLKVEDVAEFLKEKGLDKRPEGK